MDENKKALDELIRSIDYLINQKLTNCTQIFDGILLQNGKVKVNGKDYFIKQYGNFTHEVNSLVKVFIPQGNMSVAFYI